MLGALRGEHFEHAAGLGHLPRVVRAGAEEGAHAERVQVGEHDARALACRGLAARFDLLVARER